jgi:hypothetical protein
VIAVIIALATWQLLLHTLSLVETHAVDPADPQAFQGLFRRCTAYEGTFSKQPRIAHVHRGRQVAGRRSSKKGIPILVTHFAV